jgi:hypothetical protein
VAVAVFLVALCPETNPLHVPAAVPVCPPQIDDVVTYLPDQDDCSMFWECSNGHAVHFKCPDDLFYCSEKDSCDWQGDKECSYNCVNITSKTVLVEEQLIPYDLPDCPPDRNDSTTLFPNPTNCTEYYRCDHEIPTIMECPFGLWYCEEKSTCDWRDDPECAYSCNKTVTTSQPATRVKPGEITEKNQPIKLPLQLPLKLRQNRRL